MVEIHGCVWTSVLQLVQYVSRKMQILFRLLVRHCSKVHRFEYCFTSGPWKHFGKGLYLVHISKQEKLLVFLSVSVQQYLLSMMGIVRNYEVSYVLF